MFTEKMFVANSFKAQEKNTERITATTVQAKAQNPLNNAYSIYSINSVNEKPVAKKTAKGLYRRETSVRISGGLREKAIAPERIKGEKQ